MIFCQLLSMCAFSCALTAFYFSEKMSIFIREIGCTRSLILHVENRVPLFGKDLMGSMKPINYQKKVLEPIISWANIARLKGL